MTIAVISVAIMAIMLFVLGFLVSLRRGGEDTITGMSDDPTNPLRKAVRAHGNNAEWVPILAILMLYLGANEPALWVEIVIGVVALGRVAAGIGFLICETLAKPHPLKVFGALTTYIGGTLMAVMAALTVI